MTEIRVKNEFRDLVFGGSPNVGCAQTRPYRFGGVGQVHHQVTWCSGRDAPLCICTRLLMDIRVASAAPAPDSIQAG